MKKHFTLFLVLICSTLLAAQAWQSQNIPFSNPNFGWGLSVVNGSVAWALGATGDFSTSPWSMDFAGNEFARTTDGGTTWTVGTFPSTGVGFASNLLALDENTAWISYIDFGDGNNLFKTIDGGATWTPQTFVLNGWINFVHAWDGTNGVVMSDPDAQSFGIYTTFNGGASWMRVDSADIPAFQPGEFGISDVYAVEGNNVYFVTSYGRVYHSSNKGFTWGVWDAPLAAFPDAVAAGNGGTVVASFGDYSDTLTENHKCRLFRTGGDGSWTDITPADNNFAVAGMQYIPGTGTLIATFRTNNANGPFQTRISYDDGDSWTTIDEGTRIFKVDFADPSTGWGSEYKNNSDASVIYRYSGDPLSGLFDPKPLDAQVTIFPNPASDWVQVSVQAAEADDFLLMLHDAEGRCVRSDYIGQTADFQWDVDLSGLPAGLYSVRVAGERGGFFQKIVKQ